MLVENHVKDVDLKKKVVKYYIKYGKIIIDAFSSIKSSYSYPVLGPMITRTTARSRYLFSDS